jgi:SAM-dependent methyltransferase
VTSELQSATYIGNELEIFQHAENWKNYWFSQIRPFLHGAVAEVGAGIGANTEIISRGHHGTWLCIEPDLELLSDLRWRCSALNAGPPIAVASTIDALGVSTVDTVLYIDVLEHIGDDRAEVQRAASLLRPGGHLIVLSPAHQILYSEFDRAIGHHRRYSRSMMRSLTCSTLLPRLFRYLDSFGLILSAGNRLLLHQELPTLEQIRWWDRRIIPISKLTDKIVRYSLGKTILGIWQKAQ